MQRIALVVDDSRVARMTLGKLLIANEFDIVEQASGEDALAYLQSNENKPDIIFMDVMMGGMDGLTATQHIKANSALSEIPVIICTGNDSEADREQAFAKGATAVLSKPPAVDALAEIISTLPQQQEVQPSVVDEGALLTKIVATVEQTVLPKILQDVRNVAEDISRQIAADTAEKMVLEHVKLALDSQAPALKEQVMVQVKQTTEELAQQVSKRAAREVVGQIADQAVQRAVAEMDFSAQVLESLSTTGTTWLNHQERQLQSKLEQTISGSINQYLESTLTSTVAPIVTDLVNKQLAQQAVSKDGDNDEEIIKQLSKKVSLFSGIVIGLTVAVIAIGAMVLL